MLKLIRKNQKKLLAVFTALLMIVFIVDIGVRRMAPQQKDPSQKVIGQFGATEVTAGEIRGAEYLLNQLVFNILLPTGANQPDQPQFQSVIWPILVDGIGLPEREAEALVSQWLTNPVTYLLLEREARDMPVFADARQLNLSNVVLRIPDGRTVKLANVPNAEPQVRAAIASLLQVIGGFNRVADNYKASRPVVQRVTAEQAQELTAELVPFSVSEFLASAPQPTPEQLRELFDKYAKIPADTIPTDTDPLGIGYRYPPRVKLQYISVPRDLLRNVVKARKDEYAWELAINRYYLEHQKEFPTTQPVSVEASTQPATLPATQPAFRPVEEVREQILEKLMSPDVSKLGEEIRKKIESTMSADYQAIVSANPTTTMPSTAPASADRVVREVPSSLGVRYDSYEYLEKLAQSIQQQFGVLPTTVSIAELKSEPQLAQIPDIGFVARAVFAQAALLNDAPTPAAAKLLHLWQPSKPQAGSDGAMYIYRISEASPSHPPADLSEVAEQVAQDWKLTWAWDQANSAARTLMEAARTSGLRGAAVDRKVITAGPLSRMSFSPIEGLDLPDIRARARLTSEIFKLTADVTSDQQHPRRVIQLPAQRQVIVAQLTSLDSRLTPDDAQMLAVQTPLMMRQQWARLNALQWFSYDAVARRLAYVDRETADRASASAGQ